MPRTFGVEIEFAGSQNEVRNIFSRRDIPVNRHDDWSNDKWTVKSDGSVYNGGEVASRILDFDSPSDRAEARKALQLMRECGCAPSEQAGIHIHVGVDDMTPQQIANVAYGFMRHEDFAYRLASSGWSHMRDNALTYAHPYRRDDKALLIATDFAPYSAYEVAMRDRYYGLNLQNAFATPRFRNGYRDSTPRELEPRPGGTIEFRLFNSTMNAERFDAFICFAVGLVKSAIVGRLGSPKLTRYNTYPLGGMNDGWRSEHAVVNAAMRALAGGGRVLTSADRRTILKYWRTSLAQPMSFFGNGYALPGWFGEDTVREGRVASSSSSWTNYYGGGVMLDDESICDDAINDNCCPECGEYVDYEDDHMCSECRHYHCRWADGCRCELDDDDF